MNKRVLTLLKNIERIKKIEIKDQFNYVNENVIYLSTKEFTRDEVDEARETLIKEYHVMTATL
jgi:hypothetical protein